jgi:hypothetical protein
VYWRWRQWSKCGLWDRVLQTLQGWLEACGAIDWTLMCIDGTNVRAHRAAAGANDTTAWGTCTFPGIWCALLKKIFVRQ